MSNKKLEDELNNSIQNIESDLTKIKEISKYLFHRLNIQGETIENLLKESD